MRAARRAGSGDPHEGEGRSVASDGSGDEEKAKNNVVARRSRYRQPTIQTSKTRSVELDQSAPSGRCGKNTPPSTPPFTQRFSLTRTGSDVTDFEWSGREDLKLRPPGPEPDSG